MVSMMKCGFFLHSRKNACLFLLSNQTAKMLSLKFSRKFSSATRSMFAQNCRFPRAEITASWSLFRMKVVMCTGCWWTLATWISTDFLAPLSAFYPQFLCKVQTSLALPNNSPGTELRQIQNVK